MIVTPTTSFIKSAKTLKKKYQSITNDIIELSDQLEVNPYLGDLIKFHCYKIRMAITSKGKGKRGGARVIYMVHLKSEAIFLLEIFDKSEIENVSDAYLKSLIEDLKF